MLPRRFSPDPFRPAHLTAEDLRGHRVVQTLLRRREEGSRPGARSDGRRVALVIEGGGMRGVVSAGMTAAIEQLGLRDAFDEVHGASAGAFNAAFLLAGQAAYLTTLYQHGFGDPRFVSFRRALRGGPAFDMDHVINHVWTSERPLRFDAVLSGGIELHCTATDADRAKIVDLTGLRDPEEIRCAMRASARLPWLAGGPVSFRDMRLLDATLAEAIPVHVACSSGATDVLVLMTRPEGLAHSGLSPVVARLTDRYLRAINPALVRVAGDPLLSLRRADGRACGMRRRPGKLAGGMRAPAGRRRTDGLPAREPRVGAADRRRTRTALRLDRAGGRGSGADRDAAGVSAWPGGA